MAHSVMLYLTFRPLFHLDYLCSEIDGLVWSMLFAVKHHEYIFASAILLGISVDAFNMKLKQWLSRTFVL